MSRLISLIILLLTDWIVKGTHGQISANLTVRLDTHMGVAFIEEPRALLTNGWSRQQVTVELRAPMYTDIDVGGCDHSGNLGNYLSHMQKSLGNDLDKLYNEEVGARKKRNLLSENLHLRVQLGAADIAIKYKNHEKRCLEASGDFVCIDNKMIFYNWNDSVIELSLGAQWRNLKVRATVRAQCHFKVGHEKATWSCDRTTCISEDIVSMFSLKLIGCANTSVAVELWGQHEGNTWANVSNDFYTVANSIRKVVHFGDIELVIDDGPLKGERLCAGQGKLTNDNKILLAPNTTGADCILEYMRADSDILEFRSKNVLLLIKTECIGDCGKVTKPVTITLKRQTISRIRRSTWAYWLHGGPFTSHYIDNENKRLVDLMQAKESVLQNELDHEFSNVHFVMQKEHKNIALLQEKICASAAESRMENLKVWGHAENLHFIQTVSALLRDCAYGHPMAIITGEELEVICKTHLRHQFCDAVVIRDVLRCEFQRIKHINNTIQLSVSIKIPNSIKSSHQIFEIVTIPVYSEHSSNIISVLSLEDIANYVVQLAGTRSGVSIFRKCRANRDFINCRLTDQVLGNKCMEYILNQDSDAIAITCHKKIITPDTTCLSKHTRVGTLVSTNTSITLHDHAQIRISTPAESLSGIFILRQTLHARSLKCGNQVILSAPMFFPNSITIIKASHNISISELRIPTNIHKERMQKEIALGLAATENYIQDMQLKHLTHDEIINGLQNRSDNFLKTNLSFESVVMLLGYILLSLLVLGGMLLIGKIVCYCRRKKLNKRVNDGVILSNL